MGTPTVAAIDVGTNSVHLLVATLDHDRHLSPLFRMKRTIRLGDSIDQKGDLTRAAQVRLMNTLREMKKESRSFDPVYVGAATFAFRLAHNGRTFIKSVNKLLNMDIKVISPKQEAKLVFAGIQTMFNCSKKPTVCIDIGGGSTELILSGANGRPSFESLPIGCVILTKKFARDRLFRSNDLRKMQDCVADYLDSLPKAFRKAKIKQAIVSSGTGRALAKISKYLNDEEKVPLHKYEVSLVDLHEIFEDLVRLKSPEKIRKAFHISAKRSEVIIAGALILIEIMEEFEISSFKASKVGLRDGLALSYLRKKSL